MQITGLSRMTIYRLELAGKFPKRRQLSQNSVAWFESDIENWVDAHPVAQLRGTPDAGDWGIANPLGPYCPRIFPTALVPSPY